MRLDVRTVVFMSFQKREHQWSADIMQLVIAKNEVNSVPSGAAWRGVIPPKALAPMVLLPRSGVRGQVSGVRGQVNLDQ